MEWKNKKIFFVMQQEFYDVTGTRDPEDLRHRKILISLTENLLNAQNTSPMLTRANKIVHFMTRRGENFPQM